MQRRGLAGQSLPCDAGPLGEVLVGKVVVTRLR